MAVRPARKRTNHAPPISSRLTRIAVDLTAPTGLALIIREAFVQEGPERPVLIGVFMAMLGLPAIVRADEFRAKVIDSLRADEEEVEDDRSEEAV